MSDKWNRILFRWCHVLAVLGTYLLVLTCVYWFGLDQEKKISTTIGMGFGQLCLIAVWCVVGISRARLLSAALAVFGCYLAMAILVVIQWSHVDVVFFVSLAIFSVIYFFAMAAAMVVVRKLRRVTVVHLADVQISDDLSGQYGIRDIMIVMSAVAFATAICRFISIQKYASDLPEMLIVFGLISVSFFLLGWPVVVASLSKRWIPLTIFAAIAMVVIFFAQPLVFTSILGPGGDLGFFISLDIPFVLVVALHSLIARRLGYRLKAVGHSGQE